jgi:hypothetical protein
MLVARNTPSIICSITCAGNVESLRPNSIGSAEHAAAKYLHRAASKSRSDCRSAMSDESKIKGPTRRAVERVPAHGVARHTLQVVRAARRRNPNSIKRNPGDAYARLRSGTLGSRSSSAMTTVFFLPELGASTLKHSSRRRPAHRSPLAGSGTGGRR